MALLTLLLQGDLRPPSLQLMANAAIVRLLGDLLGRVVGHMLGDATLFFTHAYPPFLSVTCRHRATVIVK